MEVETLKSPLVVRYERNAALLHAQWQFLSAPHRAPSALQSLLTAAAAPRVRDCLLDLRHMPDLASMGQPQTEYHLLVQLASLPLQHLALVFKADWQHEALLAATDYLAPTYEVQVFDDDATALDWLRQTGEGYRGRGGSMGPLSN
ncbi:SpoIIAA-like [Hymenobacter actinosclerus]|uniref:SpoIIAA-like n=1 Tax=Hymenobacter actinosclerus TaxID=82805 RepID=A0A1H9Z6S9_9BACT|nr:SpoIIAA-like [Hymenobacter actinosclerus]